MNHKLLIVGLFLVITLLTPGISYAKIPAFNLIPYGGVEFGVQNIGFKASDDDYLFKKHLPKGNLFAGVKFNDYFGVEGGYETTLEKKKDVILSYPFNYLSGFILDPGDLLKTNNKIKISGLHFGMVGYYSFYFDQSFNPLSIVGYFGIKKNRLKLISNVYGDQQGLIIPRVRDFSEHSKKSLFKLSLGFQYFLYKNFGIRMLGSWENTSRFTPTTKTTTYRTRLKDSISYSVSFVFK